MRRAATRNRARIAAGALLVIACALAAAVVYGRVSTRQPVLAVAHRVAAGQVIANSDLTEVLVSTDSAGAFVSASDRQQFVGRVAAVDLVGGSILAPQQVTNGPSSATGQAVIGATLKDGQYPLDLAAGDLVWLVQVPGQSADTTGRTSTPPPPIDAVVVAVRQSRDSSAVNTSLAVSPRDASLLAVAAAQGRISIVERPR